MKALPEEWSSPLRACTVMIVAIALVVAAVVMVIALGFDLSLILGQTESFTWTFLLKSHLIATMGLILFINVHEEAQRI
jgi:hypothetical protein